MFVNKALFHSFIHKDFTFVIVNDKNLYVCVYFVRYFITVYNKYATNKIKITNKNF